VNKTHRYIRQVSGEHYAIEAVEGDRFSMTAYGEGIKPGDYLLLTENSQIVRYQIEQIDYYADPPDLWVGLLIKCFEVQR
jgi:hypothetical protein